MGFNAAVAPAGDTYTAQLCYGTSQCTPLGSPLFISAAEILAAGQDIPIALAYAQQVAKEFEAMITRMWQAKTYPSESTMVAIFGNAIAADLANDTRDAVGKAGAAFAAAGFPAAAGATASTPPSGGGASRATGTILLGTTSHDITLTLLPSDGIGAVCGSRVLRFAGLSETNTRVFKCDGTGTYTDDSPPPNNVGTFTWGYAVVAPDKSRLQIKSFQDWGFTTNTELAVGIFYKFDKGDYYSGMIGIVGGKVLQGAGYGYQSD